MTKLAIIGTGIAGLGCAYFLHPRFDLTLFEQNSYAGGHTNTVTVTEGTRPVPIDTGFMVYNEVTYPQLTRLFRELQVAVKPTSMSFSVQHVPTGLEYCGSSLNHLFGQRKNLLRPRFWQMLARISRFNAEAIGALQDAQYASHSVREYVAERGYGEDFLNFYLVPMSSAVWSTPPAQMLEFPAMTLLRFFHNHGFLGLHTQHPWLTVVNGAKSYVQKLTEPFQSRIRLNEPIKVVTRSGGQAQITLASGKTETFDKVILACHADQALRLLADADMDECALLGEFKYQPNLATLHTDTSVMPRTRLCWSSWNYRITTGQDGQAEPMTVYWMNSLQGVSERENYFVSVNGAADIAPEKILKQIPYEHPLFSLGAVRAQEQLPALNQRSPAQSVYFCGSYFKYGFHEDAFASALELSRVLTGERLWT